MNWYDGIVIVPGMEEIPFVQTWPQVLKKREMAEPALT